MGAVSLERNRLEKQNLLTAANISSLYLAEGNFAKSK